MNARMPGTSEYSTPSDREIRVVRAFSAPRKLVYEAMSNPKHVPKWMTGPEGVTMPVCEMDVRAGGKWRFVYRMANGQEMTLQGSYREIVPLERMVSTESWGPEWPETVNTMELAESQGVTTMTLTVLYPSKEARDAALGSGMKEGMDRGFARLDTLLPSFA
ncbi:hypothetical protein DSM104443_00865 [Usitatibacter rugosus]|uniref:Activator of Hsp90 ATPase homologue 1/2-like C-terminal domain-containing protein n=1 Tax=Usitatibacter rugosus TaxID=2732067 RepID=A0A6M4GRY0_9PROT|nr:SRPBCC family protein [Usitatibacter rugosus]QJR09815.1 hypothetical protein DSM104443_00865 [Usitatibacter rugosus]